MDTRRRTDDDPPAPVIEFADVCKVFVDPQGRKTTAVDHFTLDVAEGETVSLIGTSGCGKTTTMRLVNRLAHASSGTVSVAGKDVSEWDVIALRRRIGYVVQAGGLFPHMTVEKNIGLLCELEGQTPAVVRTRAHELLELVNLPAESFAGRYPRELSGGQRQRVGVARALALDPPCILMDEPFGALDPITRDEIHGEFIQLRDRVKKTIILVTHHMGEAFKLADRVALMNAGKIVQVGVEQDFRARPANDFVEQFLHSHLGEARA